MNAGGSNTDNIAIYVGQRKDHHLYPQKELKVLMVIPILRCCGPHCSYKYQGSGAYF